MWTATLPSPPVAMLQSSPSFDASRLRTPCTSSVLLAPRLMNPKSLPLVFSASPTTPPPLTPPIHRPMPPCPVLLFTSLRPSGRWELSQLPRPLIGAHVRVGDGCWDSKRGGCKYVKRFDDIVSALRAEGFKSGTIFLATDNVTIAQQALEHPPTGFLVATLREDRKKVQKSHGKREGDDMLHLQLLDLALLSQTEILAGVFGSTFIKAALQLGSAAQYISLDTFHWCPLLRCYWFWQDMCHNCDMCSNLGGVGETCAGREYHTPFGLDRVMSSHRQGRPEPTRASFFRFMDVIARGSHCRPFAYHPLGRAGSRSQWPVVGSMYATPLPPQPGMGGAPPQVCIVTSSTNAASAAAAARAVAAGYAPSISEQDAGCKCGFLRYFDVDNAHAQRAKPAFGFGLATVPLHAPSLEACERACCDEPTCYSVVWLSSGPSDGISQCTAQLMIAHGARKSDRCWHPTLRNGTVSSLRLPGAWEEQGLRIAAEVRQSRMLIETGSGRTGATYLKNWGAQQHYGLPVHFMQPQAGPHLIPRDDAHTVPAPPHSCLMPCGSFHDICLHPDDGMPKSLRRAVGEGTTSSPKGVTHQ